MSTPKQINDYIILYSHERSKLTEQVHEYVLKGWKLYGAPYGTVDTISVSIHNQAMVREGAVSPPIKGQLQQN